METSIIDLPGQKQGLAIFEMLMICVDQTIHWFPFSPDDARVRVWNSSEWNGNDHHHPAEAGPVAWRTNQVRSALASQECV